MDAVPFDEFAAALGYDVDELRREAEAERATWTEARCPWGRCFLYLDPAGRIASGTGPVLCPWDHSPG